jgi:Zn finger protein HypA/HybF involved in hydrogenase expression
MNTSSPTKKCLHCAEEINIEAKKCKHCGEFLDRPIQSTPEHSAKSTLVRKMPYWKAVLRMIVYGFIISIAGLMILPILPVGLMMIVGSPIFAFMVNESNCPYCGSEIVWMIKRTVVKCRHCKQRSMIQDMHLVRLKTLVQTSK